MTPPTVTPAKMYTLVLIIWAVMFATVGVYYFLVVTVLLPAEADPNLSLVYIFLGLSILMVLTSLYFKTRFGAGDSQLRALAKVRAGYILALVFSEIPALFGLISFVVVGFPHYWIFFAISVVAFILNFPRRDAFEQASP
jgi:hypothetical protein